MNKEQRAQLEEAYRKLDDLRGPIQEVLDIITSIKDEESEKLDNMQEKFSGTDRYSEMEATKESLESAVDELQTAVDSIENAVANLEVI
jgi:histidinol dehydrogenase